MINSLLSQTKKKTLLLSTNYHNIILWDASIESDAILSWRQ